MAEKKVLLNVEIKNKEALKALADLKNQVSLLKAEQKNLDTSTESGRQRFEALGQQIKALNTESRNYEKQIQNNIKAQNEEKGSIQSLKTKLSEQTAAYNKLSESKRNSAKGRELEISIKKTSDALVILESALGNNSRQVGSYKESIIDANKSIGGMRAQISELKKTLDGLDINSKEFKDTKDSIDKLSVAVDQAAGKVDEFGNREPKNLVKKNFEDTLTTVAILGSALSSLSRAMEENGVSSEATAKAVKGVELALVAANIAKEKGAIIDTLTLVKEKALIGLKITLNAITKIFGVTSATAWALASGGLTVLISGIILLIANFDKVTNSIKSFFGIAKDFTKVNESIKETTKTLDDFSDQTQLNIDRLKAQGKSELELWTYKKKRYEEELALNRKRYAELKSAGRKLTEDEKSQLEESTKFIKQSAKAKFALETELIGIKKKNANEALDIEKKNNEKTAALNKAAREKRLKDIAEEKAAKEKEAADKLKAEQELAKIRKESLQLLKSNTEFEISERTKLYKDALAVIQADENLTADEIAFYKINLEKQLNDEISTIRKNAIVTRAALESKGFDEQLEKELIAIGNNERARLEIQIKSETEKLEALNKLETDGTQEQIDAKNKLISESENKIALDKAKISQLNYDTELIQARDNSNKTYKLKKDALEKELKLVKNNKDEEVRIAAELQDLKKEYAIEQIEQVENYANKSIELASMVSQIMSNISQGEVERAEFENNAKKEKLDKQLNSGLISQKKYAKETEKNDKALDKEKARIQREAAIRERKIATFQTIINTAAAIAKTFATLGWPAGIVGAAIAAATGIAQIAVINSAPLPKASRGMMLQGASHAQGGIPIEAEGGEAIINKRSTQMFAPLLSKINQAGGGVKFADGGLVGGYSFNDGGYAQRNLTTETITADTMKDAMASAVSELKVYTAIEDVRREDKKYSEIEEAGTL